MKRLGGTILILAVISSAVLFFIPASHISTDTDGARVYYMDEPDIIVTFPNGKEIGENGRLTVVAYSDIYDLEHTGLMLYKYTGGVADTATVVNETSRYVTGYHEVTYEFFGMTEDAEMHFTEPMRFDAQQDVTDGSGEDRGPVGDNIWTTAIMLVSMILAAAMLAVMMYISRMISQYSKNPEGTP